MTIHFEQAVCRIKNLGESELAAFFARLMYELTLSARSISICVTGPAEIIGGLMAVNQLQHLLSSQLMTISSGSKDRISPEDFVEMFILETDVSPIVQHEVHLAFQAAIDSVCR